MLQFLNMRSVILRSEGALKLADALLRNSALTFLNLAANDLTSKCAQRLFQVISLTNIIDLDVSENIWGDLGVHLLGQKLLGCKHSKMQKLCLRKSGFSN